MEHTKPKRKLLTVIVLALVVILILLGYYLWQNGFSLNLLSRGADYQAVFLSNGQVYFGRVFNINSTFVTLRDIYYLQVSQVLQPVQGKREQQPPQQTLSLAKLGTVELHRPKDEMKINRDHIIFIEDLKDDSQVVQAIERYKAGL